ncbi:gamma-glutamyltransferase [Ramlibacter ginsenosidimutans]|uniref:gamma-glutamyltransferase n=1 Tax=Ramlibacter ginsenosidimutans TaxID=502333 RepID=UPI00191CE7DF
MRRLVHSLLIAAGLLAGCASTPPSFTYQPPSELPPVAFNGTAKPGWATHTFAVAAAHPLAVDAGYQVLRAGGTAVDAAVAVQAVLTLVEPQSSGIGGGAFLLHYDGHDVVAYDGRETAPAAATERLFLDADGKPLSFHAAVVGGRSVGVPGVLRMQELAHREHGRLPWATLFAPAIWLAENGFPISERLHAQLSSDRFFRNDPAAFAYFYTADGKPLPAGTRLRNPELAQVLRRIAREGSSAFYEGEVAQAIVAKVRGHATNPGAMTLADLAGYRARERQPLCSDYRAHAHDYRICGFPPPGSGAIAVAQILGILSQTPASGIPLANGLPTAPWLHLYTEAARLAFADRGLYVGDPDFVQPPAGRWESLLAPAYLARRARLIGPASMKTAQPGNPGAAVALAPAEAQPEHGTSQVSIVDPYGNAVSMTTTVEDQFGSRQMVKGFVLNNELTDFNFAPAGADGRPVANRVQPGKRPRSSMDPTFVFDKASGQLVMVTGAMGGPMIIHQVAKHLYGVLDWGLDVQRAIELPNFGSLNGPTLLEPNRFPPATVRALQSMGHEVEQVPFPAGIQAIQRTPGGWFGGADPRRDGIVMGD